MKLTREDVVPVWALEVLEDLSPSDGGYDIALEVTGHHGVVKRREHSQGRPEFVVRSVCNECNSGWMSQLEAQVRPIVEPLIRGERTRLDLTDQAVVARWAAMKAVMVDALRPGSIVLAAEDTDWVRLRMAPPPAFRVRLAYREDAFAQPFDLLFAALHAEAPSGGEEIDERTNAFSIAFATGHLVLGVTGGPSLAPHSGWLSGHVPALSIWPPTLAGLNWPPEAPRFADRDQMYAWLEAPLRIVNPQFLRPNAVTSADGPKQPPPADAAPDRPSVEPGSGSSP